MIRVIKLKAIPTTMVRGLITQSVVYWLSEDPHTKKNITNGIVSKAAMLRSIFATNRCVPILISASCCSDLMFVTPGSPVVAYSPNN